MATSTHPPLSVGASPNRVHILTDMSRDATTVTTALMARPILDFTRSILPRWSETRGGMNVRGFIRTLTCKIKFMEKMIISN